LKGEPWWASGIVGYVGKGISNHRHLWAEIGFDLYSKKGTQESR